MKHKNGKKDQTQPSHGNSIASNTRNTPNKSPKDKTLLSGYTICTSNIEEFRRDELKNLIESLGGKFSLNFKKSTNLILSNKINTEKCHVAVRNNIPVVSLDWLRDSQKYQKVQNTDNYRLKCFQGAKLALFGYNKSEEAGLKKLIKNFKGEIEENLNEAEIIIVKSGLVFDLEDLTQLKPYANITVIDLWVHKCIEKSDFVALSYFKFENDYFKKKFEKIEKDYLEYERILSEEISGKRLEKTLVKLKLDIKDDLESQDEYISVKKILLIFSEFIFFLSDDLNKMTREILIKAISFGKGIVFNKITPITTHIICNSNKNNYNKHALSFGSLYCPLIISPNWVLDSLDKKQLLPAIDYQPALESLKININTYKEEVIINSVIISNIFKNQIFYIYTESYNEDQLQTIREKIFQHSGEIVTDQSLEEKKPHFIIVNDGYSSYEMANLISKRIENYQFIMSHRYIDFCIEKRELIDFSQNKFYHVLPFESGVPFQDFSEVIVFFHGLSLPDSNVLEHLVETLGGKCELSNQTTHIIVEEKLDERRINYYRNKYSQNIQYLSTDWLLECMFEGRRVKEDKFILENSKIKPMEEQENNKLNLLL